MKNIYLLALLALIQLTFTSEAQTIQWQNTIGGSNLDVLYGAKQTADGGYILGGYSMSPYSGDKTEDSRGFQDYWVLKLDTSGNIQWQKTVGGSNSDILTSIEQTTDHGYILGGYSNSDSSGDKSENSFGDYDYWIVKLDSAGVIQWQNTIGGSQDDRLYSVEQTTDGGYILGGSSSSSNSGDKVEFSQGNDDYWVVKLDANGLIEWQNTIGGSGYDYLFSVKQTTDGGYILGGASDSGISGDKTEDSLGDFDYWVVKLDPSGNILWQNTIGGSDDDELSSVEQTSDGGYIVGGTSMSSISGDKTKDQIGWSDYWILKLDESGNIQWQNTIGGDDDDELSAIHQTTDGGYILGGTSFSGISGDKTEDTFGDADYWMVKVDESGLIVWQTDIGGEDADYMNSIEQASDGSFILGGSSQSNTSGDKTENSQGEFDYWVVKIEGGTTTSVPHLTNSVDIKVYPNPVTDMVHVDLSDPSNKQLYLYNSLGQMIYSKNNLQSSESINFNNQNASPGVYQLIIRDGSENHSFKIVKQ